MTAPAGILDRLLGAPMSAARPTGLLTADDYAAARQQGLLGLGGGLLAASGGGPYANLNQRLAIGLAQGQGAYQQALDRAQATAVAGQNYDFNNLKMQGAQQSMERQQQIEQGRNQIIQANPMPDSTAPGALASWIDRVLPSFIRLGDTDTLGKLSEIRKSLGNDATPTTLKSISGTAVGLDPKKAYTVRVDRTGNIVGKPMEESASPNTLAGLDFRESMTPVQQARIANQIISSFRNFTRQDDASVTAWAQMQQIAQRAAAGTGAPDDLIGLVDVMSKLYNPGAVVRVGTVQITMAKLGSWKQKLENWKAQGLTGAPDPELVRLIAAAASKIAEEHAAQYEDKRQRHLAWGERYGLDLDPILPDVWGVTPEDAPNPAATTPTNLPPLRTFNFGGTP